MVPKRIGYERCNMKYLCRKCGNTVGHFSNMDKYGNSEWVQDNFCQRCGEKVDWLTSCESEIPILILKKYKCGHFCFGRETVTMHPEEYGTDLERALLHAYQELCPMCQDKKTAMAMMEGYRSCRKSYSERKKMMEAGEDFFTDVSDKMIEDEIRKMEEDWRDGK